MSGSNINNGEWTSYSHLAHGSVTAAAKLRVGDRVKAGQFLGTEAAVGCAMLEHVHFEVARPATPQAIDEGDFLIDNDGSKRNLEPRFCHVAGGSVVKDQEYVAQACK